MKFRFTVDVDVAFDLECDGDVSTETASVDSDVVGQTINIEISNAFDEHVDSMIDAVSDATGQRLNSLSLTVVSAECIDYLD
jgi:hypothetical protein